jgi:hypothetical protein
MPPTLDGAPSAILTDARLGRGKIVPSRERATTRCARSPGRSGANTKSWVADVAEHPIDDGRLYCGVVNDACGRRVVGR